MSPRLIHLRKGYRRAYKRMGLISEEAYSQNRKSMSIQAIAVLIKIRFAFAGF